ncbi:MAG: hypothetical protein SF069_02080 [Phycisphaerae bacterium]|nr:hypothetical protein [Phycisphaerae bacterium]
MRRCLTTPAARPLRAMTSKATTKPAPAPKPKGPSAADRAVAIRARFDGIDPVVAAILTSYGFTVADVAAVIEAHGCDELEAADRLEWKGSGDRLPRVFNGDIGRYLALRKATRRHRDADAARAARLTRLKGGAR